MKFLLLVCWDAERMDAQTERDPTDTPEEEEEGFPWLDDLQAKGSWITGDELRRLAARAPSASRREGDRHRRPFAETKRRSAAST